MNSKKNVIDTISISNLPYLFKRTQLVITFISLHSLVDLQEEKPAFCFSLIKLLKDILQLILLAFSVELLQNSLQSMNLNIILENHNLLMLLSLLSAYMEQLYQISMWMCLLYLKKIQPSIIIAKEIKCKDWSTHLIL